MKVMLVGNYDQIHTRRYLHLILKAGCEAVLLNTGPTGTQIGEIPTEKCYTFPKSGRRLTRYLLGSSVANKLGDSLVRLQLRRLWASTRPDIIHVQWIDEKAWRVAEAGASPLVLTAWGSDLNSTRDSSHDPVQLQRKADVIAKSALLITDSQDMIDVATNLAKAPVRSMLLAIGIDTNLFCPASKAEAYDQRQKLNIPNTAMVVLSPRAFRNNYGHDIILRAFARAVRMTKVDAYIVFKAYECFDRSYIDTINSTAADCEVQDRVRIIEEMPYQQLPIYYAMGDFAVNFPDMDAFPVAFIECLACELPVLTKHLPAYDGFGITPYLRFTDSPSEESLEIGISTMLSSLCNWSPDMSQARAYVSTNLDEAVVARTLGQAYDRVLNDAIRIPNPKSARYDPAPNSQ